MKWFDHVKAFDCIRVWALCHHGWIPTLIVFALSVFDPAINIVRMNMNLMFLVKSYNARGFQYVNIPALKGVYMLVPSGPLAGCWSITSFNQFR